MPQQIKAVQMFTFNQDSSLTGLQTDDVYLHLLNYCPENIVYFYSYSYINRGKRKKKNLPSDNQLIYFYNKTLIFYPICITYSGKDYILLNCHKT